MNTSPLLKLSKDTLLVIPCSARKERGSKPSNALSILSALDTDREAKLKTARNALGGKARVDQTLMPAYLRYSGELYKQAYKSIGEAVAAGQRVLIVSGAYGLLLADEPIGWYDRKFALSDWPDCLLGGCILDYACHEGIQSVIAVMASTSNYAKLIRRIDWTRADLEATLVSPIAHGGGDMVKVPRAQGQAIATLINTGLYQAWRSSDGLSLRFERVCKVQPCL